MATLLFWLAWQRYSTFHNQTFDLALYGRMAWGMVRGQFWDPVTNANTLGVHIMPILLPLGVLGEVFGRVQTLLAAQSIMLAGTAIPLYFIARRRLGDVVGLVAPVLWWTYPHIFHVASYEFHPGSLGVFFLASAIAVDASEEPPKRAWWWLLAGAVCCREDIALSVACLVLMRSRRALHLWVALGCLIYFLVYAFVLVPMLGPKQNSVVLHFGHWGSSLPEVAFYLMTHPGELLAFVFSPERVRYLLVLFGCLGFLPLLGARWLLPALPFLAINLVSAWPTAVELDSHYQTLLLPFLFLAAIEGLAKLKMWRVCGFYLAAAVAVGCAIGGHFLWGGSWLARDFKNEAFASDPRSNAASHIVAKVPAAASVQAPYPLMAHLMAREWIAAAPPPDRNFDVVVLDLSSRAQYVGDDTILRTDEEPFLRAWLGRDDYGLVAVRLPYALLKRGARAREWARSEGYLQKSEPAESEGAAQGNPLTSCLSLQRAWLEAKDVVLELMANAACDKDLAIRLGDVYRPARVELLFDGLLNPAQLHRGDVLISRHRLSEQERKGMRDTGVCVGAVRQSGVRPEKSDPVSVCVPLSQGL